MRATRSSNGDIGFAERTFFRRWSCFGFGFLTDISHFVHSLDDHKDFDERRQSRLMIIEALKAALT